ATGRGREGRRRLEDPRVQRRIGVLHMAAYVYRRGGCCQEGQDGGAGLQKQRAHGASSERPGRVLDETELVEGGTQDLLWVGSEVAAKDLLVDRADADLVLQVAGRVQVRQAGRLAVHAALEGTSDQDERRGRAVVGAAAGVLLGPPSELRPGGNQDLVGHSVSADVLVEGADGR